MTCGIYKIENKINGKVYIGQSTNIEQRWKGHINKSFCEKDSEYESPLHRAIRKYEKENFEFTIIEECSPSELNQKECYWIKRYNSLHAGYNRTSGGEKPEIMYRKLNQNKIDEIVNLLKNTKLTQKEIAKKYNVCASLISHINTGTWGYKQKVNETLPIRKETLKNPHYNKPKPLKEKTYHCINCGQRISKRAKRCSKCEHENRRTKPPISKKELEKLIQTTSFLQIAKQYNVSDNTIRKWCKKHNLPYRKKDVKDKYNL